MRAALIIAAIELVAAIVGLCLVRFAHLPWWTVICLVVPPVLVVLGIIGSLVGSSSRGENPFQ